MLPPPPQALDVLNAHFEKNTHPSGAEMTLLAEQLKYDREVVRVWFCNKRQALKNTIKRLKSDRQFPQGVTAVSPLTRQPPPQQPLTANSLPQPLSASQQLTQQPPSNSQAPQAMQQQPGQHRQLLHLPQPQQQL